MKISQRFLILIYVLIVSSASAQDPLVFIEPVSPNSNDIIRIGVKVDRCDTMPYENPQGLTHSININETNIELNTFALKPLLPGGIVCFPPNPIAYYELGVLDKGDYSLATWVYSQFMTTPFPPNFDPPPPYELINFSVTAAPVKVASNTYLGLLLIFIVLLGTGLYRTKS